MNQTILIIDAQTGEQNERELTADEIDDLEMLKLENETQISEVLAAQQAREASIRKMAEASGLTEAEIEALF